VHGSTNAVEAWMPRNDVHGSTNEVEAWMPRNDVHGSANAVEAWMPRNCHGTAPLPPWMVVLSFCPEHKS